MRSIAVDSAYDIVMGADRNLEMVVDKAAVQQDCLLATQMLTGEYPYDTTRGVDYMGTIFKNKLPFEFEESVRAELLRVPEVNAVVEFRLIQVGDILEFEAVIESNYGRLGL
jgi:hypothetical protein